MDDFPEFIARLPELDISLEGVSGHLLQGQNQQVAFVRFQNEIDVPEHSHKAQWELVVAGEVRLRVHGEEKIYRAGESFYIPEGIVHGALVGAGYKAIIIFDQADRYGARSS